MQKDSPTSMLPRARPVSGLPVEALAERAEDLARRWAIALVLSRPLEGLGGIPLEELAREAPALCEQLLWALDSESALERLTGEAPPTGREQPAACGLRVISGAEDSTALVDAVEGLRGVIWEALLELLGSQGAQQPLSARLVADAGDRLAYVCSRLLGASIGEGEREPARGPAAETVVVAASTAASAAPWSAEPRPPVPERGADVHEPGQRGRGGLAIIDEAAPARGRHSGSREPQPPRREVEIRDVRGEGARAPWAAAIEREIQRFKRDGRPFAVLLVELRGVDALAAGGSPERAARLAQEAERVLAAEVRQAARSQPLRGEPGGAGGLGSLTRESAGRLWLLAPDSDRAATSELARRLERAVGRPASHGGGTLGAWIGAAVCPDDGTDAGALAAHADMELYASRKGEELFGPGGAMPPQEAR